MKKQTHILIVDDSPAMRAGLARELEQLGFAVTEAVDGQSGFDTARSQEFELTITDIEMPRMNGFALCEKLKQSPSTRSIPVIILSSCDTEADIVRGFKIGAAAYVSKSNAQQELLQRIQDILQKKFFLREQLVLVVDDSEMIRNAVRDGLAHEGYQVATARNGKEALLFLTDQRPDLILCELTLPEMDGYSFCAALRTNPEWASIPFVAMSTSSDRGTMRRILGQGGCA